MVLELTLVFLNKCLVLQKPSHKLRSLVVGELVVLYGGLSVLEDLVIVSKPMTTNTAKVETMCHEISQVDFILFLFIDCVLTFNFSAGVELSHSVEAAGNLLWTCRGRLPTGYRQS